MSMNLDEFNFIKLSPLDLCACVSIDVIKSEDFKNKAVVEKTLTKIVNVLNKKFKNFIVVPFQVRGGDEVLGVTSSFSIGFKVFREVRRLAWKYKINLYFGLGFGTLDTGTITDINRINGSAVINACRAVDTYLKSDSTKPSIYLNQEQHVKFYALGNKDFPYQSINALVYMLYNELNQSPKQKDLIKLMELYPEKTYEEYGIELGYSVENASVNVYKLISRSDLHLYEQLQQDIIITLQKLQKIYSKGLNRE